MNLYKYISSDIWDKILKNKQIRFTQPSLFNDPFEMQPFYESFAEDVEVQKNLNEADLKTIMEEQFLEQYPNLPAEIQNIVPVEFLKSFAALISPLAVENAPAVLDGLTAAISKGLYTGFNDNLGVLALSEKCDNLLMWAHYAQNHKGLVIGFDSEHRYFHQQLSPSDEFRYVRKVRYSKSRPNIRLTTIEDVPDIFLTKSEDWKYEYEWRVMRPLVDAAEMINVNDEPIHLYSFPPDCVAEVIFGCRMSPQLKEEILEYLANDEQYSRVKIYVAVLDEREFKLNMVLTEI
jgi:hypothetical protein